MGRTSDRRRFAKNQRDGGQFVALPHVVLDSRAYISASTAAKTLLVDMARQFNGRNNGDLSCAWKLMEPLNWRSEATLNRAKKELIERGLISETRKGARPNKASLYGLTWLACDLCGGKLDIDHRQFPRGLYAKYVDSAEQSISKSRRINAVATTKLVAAARLVATKSGVRTA